MNVIVGLSIGQRRHPSALCVVETEDRTGPHRTETHYLVRHLERLPPGTTYPALADRTAEISARVVARSAGSPVVYLDATGLGDTVVDLFSGSCAARIVAVYFNHGDRRQLIGYKEVRLGKAYLVARLQTFLQTGRLHLPSTPGSHALAEELVEYEIHMDEGANDRYGAFRVGPQDEMVTALGLACQPKPPISVYGPE